MKKNKTKKTKPAIDKKEKKLIKVQFEFDDGTIQLLSGRVAGKWLKAVDSCCMMSGIHGFPMTQFRWAIIKA